MSHHQPSYTRRNLLRAAGILSASAAIWGTRAGGATAQSLAAPLRLGVALPTSATYPQLQSSILAGLHLYFSQYRPRPVALRTTTVTGTTGAIQATVAALLADGPLDCLIGMVTPTAAAALRQQLAAHGTLFVNATEGANLPRTTDYSAQILHSSLAHWQSSWALGRWAAGNVGKRAILATSLYDSGYDAFYAFQLGFESLGGTIVSTQVSVQSPTQADLAPLTTADADFVYAAYSGSAAAAFITAYAGLPAASRLPLLGSTFLTDEGLLLALGEQALGIRTVATWSPTLNTVANQAFMAAYQEQTGGSPDMLAVLGFDTARLIDQLYQQATAPALHSVGLLAGLAATDRFSPRGSARIEQPSQVITTPLYLREVRATPVGFVNAIVGAVPGPVAIDPAIADLGASLKTGWTTPYFCG